MGDVRLLLIEDDVRMATAIRRGLRTEGIVADVAGRGDTALGMARATDYDALVLDVMLPGIDGFETWPAARRRRVDADHHAHRPRRGRGPDPWPRRGG